MVNFDTVKSEKGLRTLILRNLNKEIHPATKPSVDFIYKILEDAYASGLHYDVTDMRNGILAFAASSTHQADACLKLVNKMSLLKSNYRNRCSTFLQKNLKKTQKKTRNIRCSLIWREMI